MAKQTKSDRDAQTVKDNSTPANPFPPIPDDVNIHQDKLGRSRK